MLLESHGKILSTLYSTTRIHLKRIKRTRYLHIPSNGSKLRNPDISGALYTLRIQCSYTQTQCEDGARDVRVL